MLSEWDLEDITAQCFVFFLAGFETMASAIYNMSYSLALNPEVQQKLLDEIDEAKEILNGRIPCYEDIQKMDYLDMVVTETLRIYPSVPVLERRCTKQTTLENNDGNVVNIYPGDCVYIPVINIHMDPNYYAEPEKFNPERFSPENRDSIKPGTYFPFGNGPRACIGSRFALMVIKAFAFSILSKFSIDKCSKTEIPLKIQPDVLVIRPMNGIWLALKPRN